MNAAKICLLTLGLVLLLLTEVWAQKPAGSAAKAAATVSGRATVDGVAHPGIQIMLQPASEMPNPLSQTPPLTATRRDSRVTINNLLQARAAWQASQGTAEQAARAYSIAEVRYKEGISTQIELNDARILLEQAVANRALAARNLQVARVKLALLPNLPLQATGSTQGAQAQIQSAATQQSQTQQTTPSTQAAQQQAQGQQQQTGIPPQ